MGLLIPDNSTVLFQGDSVTDCGRSREDEKSMGNGYANMVSARISADYPQKNIRFINRGISGNRVVNLEARWQEDCIDLKPDFVSILIGINDCWRRYDRDDPTPVEKYEEGYRNILGQIKEKLKARIIIMEPFVLPVPKDRESWREDLDPKIHAARKLAREFDAIYIPLDGLFAQASTQREPAFWAADGVHPTQAGHALISNAWLKAVGAL